MSSSFSVHVWGGGTYGAFPTRKEAELRVANFFPNVTNFKVVEYLDEEWRVRGRREFHEAENRLVWEDEHWFTWKIEETGAYPRVSPKDPQKISYYPDEKKAIQGVRQVTTPGRFLKKFYGDLLSEADIKKYADMHRERYIDASLLLQWASTPEEIVKVYTMPASFSSCMQGERNFKSPVHPTYVYGAGDLKVAYIVRDGTLIARALVWPEKGKVGRVYGDVSLLRNALKGHGIKTKSDTDYYDTFAGARLLHIPNDKIAIDYEDFAESVYAIVAPYVDGAEGNDYGAEKIDDTYLRIVDTNNEYKCQFILADAGGSVLSRVKCGCCNKYTRGDGTSKVYHDKETFEYLCRDCKEDERVVHCEISGLYFFRSDKITLISVRGATARFDYISGNSYYEPYVYAEAVQEALNTEDVVTSSYSNELYYKYYTEEMADGTFWGRDEFCKHGGKCHMDGLKSPRSSLVEIRKGVWVHKDSTAYYSLFPAPIIPPIIQGERIAA